MTQDIVGINRSSILYLVYVLLSATAPDNCIIYVQYLHNIFNP